MNRFFGQQTLSGEWHALLPRYSLISERVTGRRVLDIGCGSGIGASLLHDMGASYVNAIDHRPAVLNVAKSRSEKEGLSFEVMFWEDLAFEDDTFDIVICLDPASPVSDTSLLLEVKRVLKPTGEYICAIERRTRDGLEILLPRYGYPNAAEQIELYSGHEQVPQLGEVKRFFPHVSSVTQRPRLSYSFSSSPNNHPGHSLDVDNRFCNTEDDPGSVELWFCSETPLNPIPEKEIQLPYTEIVHRLAQAGNQFHRQPTGEHKLDSPVTAINQLFDEIVEDPSDAPFDFDEPTTTKARNRTVDPNFGHAKRDRFDIDSDFDTIQALRGSAEGADFEDRISTNARYEPLTPGTILQDDLQTNSPELEALRAEKDAEIERLKQMFDGLTAVVERQSEMIQSFLQQGESAPAATTTPAAPATPETPEDGSSAAEMTEEKSEPTENTPEE